VPKFQIAATFELTTEIEVDLSPSAFDNGNVDYDEFSDESYFQTTSVESSGGDLRFVVIADDEDEARALAAEVIHDGQEIEDRNGLTWLVDSVDIEVEPVEEPMDKERALSIVQKFIEDSVLDAEVKEALIFLIRLI
jgi:copper chaperone CopZ